MSDSSSRLTLQDLPFPAKIVITAFLVSVGMGYGWALMQLHFKHATKGNLAPTPTDVVERFSGQRAPWEKDEAPPADNKAGVNLPAPKGEAKLVAGAKIKSIIVDRCVWCHGPDGEKSDIPLDTFASIKKHLDDPPQKGKFHKVINKDNDDNFNKDNMVQSFTRKSTDTVDGVDMEWKDLIKKRPEAELRAERDTERKTLLAWLEAGAPEEAYNKDAFPIPEELRKDGKVKIWAKYGGIQAPEMSKEEKAAALAAATKKKNPKERQLSVESLTQSTHAHLLTFSILWAATGLVFAFTSYSLLIRTVVAPVVLIAQVGDICCWWLARLPDVGPYFALAIMGTGAVVGLGLGLQIVLSLLNMYAGKGKVVILLMLLAGGATGGLVYAKYIGPMVADEKQAAAK